MEGVEHAKRAGAGPNIGRGSARHAGKRHSASCIGFARALISDRLAHKQPVILNWLPNNVSAGGISCINLLLHWANDPDLRVRWAADSPTKWRASIR